MNPHLPIPSLDAASQALEQQLPQDTQKQISDVRAAEDAEALAIAEKLGPELQAWQRRIIAFIVGQDILDRADQNDAVARQKIAAHQIKFVHKVKKAKDGNPELVYIAKRTLPESNRSVVVGRFRFHFGTKTATSE